MSKRKPGRPKTGMKYRREILEQNGIDPFTYTQKDIIPICDDVNAPDLTPNQRQFVNVLLLPGSSLLSNRKIAELVGCHENMVTYNKANPKVLKVSYHLRKKIVEMHIPEILATMVLKAKQGSVEAFDRIMKYIGEFDFTAKALHLTQTEIENLPESEIDKLIDGQ